MLDVQRLSELRTKIDKIDNALLEFLIQRTDISAEIGNLKMSLKKEIFDRNRESIIFKNLEIKCREMNINFEYIKNIWNIILNNSHEIQIKGKK